MKRSPFISKLPPRRPVRDPAEFASYVPQPCQARMATAHDTSMLPRPKASRFESEAWRRAVASLACVLCGKQGQTQCAHRNEGKGMALKTDDCFTAALCGDCHSAIDSGHELVREERRRLMDSAIFLTVRELAVRGLIGVSR